MGALRDGLVLVGAFALLLGGLYAFSQAWPPAVIVESGSMMHDESEVAYGRFGTIDPGDLVKRVRSVDDVETLVERGRSGYGSHGDVIIYHSAGDRGRTPIIHRAVAYIEVLPSDDGPTESRARVRWSPEAPCEGGATHSTDAQGAWCTYEGSVTIPSVPLIGYVPTRSGFVTKGDNPVSNRQTDQAAGIAVDERGAPSTVPLAWIDGKARGEVPWMGLIKLSLAGKVNQPGAPDAWMRIGWAYAPTDLWVMLGVTLAVVVGAPFGLDLYRAMQRRRA